MFAKVNKYYFGFLPLWIGLSAGLGTALLADSYEPPQNRFGSASIEGGELGIGVMFIVYAWITYRIWEIRRKKE